MGVDHRRADIPVSQELLDRPDVIAVFEEMGGEGMAQGVRAGGLGDASLEPRLFHGPLQNRFMEMVAPPLSRRQPVP